MPSATRLRDRALHVAGRQAREIGDEVRERRLSLDMSQQHVASECGMSRGRYRLIETGQAVNLSLDELNIVAAILGLEPAVRLYPGGPPIRDRAHAGRLAGFLANAKTPLRSALEVALPQREGAFERRAWDAMLYGGGERTAIELEMRIRDVQAMRRRHDLKRRDDPTEHFLLLIANTRSNRRVLAEFEQLFADLPRLRPSAVRAALEAGRHPGTGLLLV